MRRSCRTTKTNGFQKSSYWLSFALTHDNKVRFVANVRIISSVCYFKHPSYSNSGATGYPNDIAVLVFSAVTYNSNLNAIALATSSDGNYAGATCTITGWGRTCGSKLRRYPTLWRHTDVTCHLLGSYMWHRVLLLAWFTHCEPHYSI
jgi:hypothetical protein